MLNGILNISEFNPSIVHCSVIKFIYHVCEINVKIMIVVEHEKCDLVLQSIGIHRATHCHICAFMNVFFFF